MIDHEQMISHLEEHLSRLVVKLYPVSIPDLPREANASKEPPEEVPMAACIVQQTRRIDELVAMTVNAIDRLRL